MNVLAIFAVVLGAVVAVYGFRAMLDPMRLSLNVWSDGYIQRLVLDREQRIGLRLVGAVFSFFGLTFGTAALSKIIGREVLLELSSKFLLTMALLFGVAFLSGLVLLVRDAIQGKSMLAWWTMSERGAQLGMIFMTPRFTPAMMTERKWCTAGYGLLVAICVFSAWI